MLDKNSVVAIFDQHSHAEEAVKQLKGELRLKKLSIIGKAYQTEEEVVGYYTTGEPMKHWGKYTEHSGAASGAACGSMFGSAFFLIPGIGPL